MWCGLERHGVGFRGVVYRLDGCCGCVLEAHAAMYYYGVLKARAVMHFVH